MKVCFVSHSGGLRGAEKALLEAVDALHDFPIHPHVFTPAKGPLARQLLAMGVDCSYYSAIPWVTKRRNILRSLVKSLLTFPKTIQLAHQLRKQGCQLVYSNSMAIGMGAWAAAIAQVPHIWHIHEFVYDDHALQFDLGMPVARWVFQKLGGFFIFNSHASAMRLSNMIVIDNFDKRHEVIYQSVTIPIPETQPVSNTSSRDRELTLVLVGALDMNKGQTDAMWAVKELKQQGIEADLVLVGDGPDEHYLREFAKHLEIQSNVQFVGFADNVSNWYSCADIVLVCSRIESFGRVAVEAMLSGRPVVVARTGGLQEIVEDRVTGLYYKPGDAIDLADKIKALQEDRALASRIASNGYEWAKLRFTQERYGQELYDVLRLVMLRE